jgi:hypothetical protein
MNIVQSTKRYEQWLEDQLQGELVTRDLERKHDKMRQDPFSFLRGTYWRWAERILDDDVCPQLKDAPAVLAVGDIHLENFGLWRDDEGRMVWGVNDFDEAARMPYALDLVRLATSAIAAGSGRSINRMAVCGAILQGYRDGVAAPCPIVLDKDHGWLRAIAEVPEGDRAKFWRKLAGLEPPRTGPPDRYRKVLKSRMPERGLDAAFYPRTAGTGSLGRPRWMAVAPWRGAPAIREAKALVPSGWVLAHDGDGKPGIAEMAAGRYRAPDPWYGIDQGTVVRRLSANSRKLELRHLGPELVRRRMLRLMGHELANCQLGTGDGRAAVARDLDARPKGWLEAAARAAAAFVTDEYRQWKTR